MKIEIWTSSHASSITSVWEGKRYIEIAVLYGHSITIIKMFYDCSIMTISEDQLEGDLKANVGSLGSFIASIHSGKGIHGS